MSNEWAERKAEVESCLCNLGVEIGDRLVDEIAAELEVVVTGRRGKKRVDGCLSIGGSSVKDWVRLRIARGGLLPAGCATIDFSHTVGTLHFYPWDEEKYGPRPTESCGNAVDTVRSPTHRLIDAKPIDKTAWNVTQTSNQSGATR